MRDLEVWGPGSSGGVVLTRMAGAWAGMARGWLEAVPGWGR